MAEGAQSGGWRQTQTGKQGGAGDGATPGLGGATGPRGPEHRQPGDAAAWSLSMGWAAEKGLMTSGAGSSLGACPGVVGLEGLDASRGSGMLSCSEGWPPPWPVPTRAEEYTAVVRRAKDSAPGSSRAARHCPSRVLQPLGRTPPPSANGRGPPPGGAALTAPVPATVLLGKPGRGRGAGLRTWSQGIYTGLQQLHLILKGSTFQPPKRLPSPHPGLCSPRVSHCVGCFLKRW